MLGYPAGRHQLRESIIRVLHVVKATGISGAERHLLLLLPRLRSLGVDPHLALFESEGGHLLRAEAQKVGLEVHSLSGMNHLSLRAVPELLRVIGIVKPALIHTHLLHADIYGQTAATIAGLPAVMTVHSVHVAKRGWTYRVATRFAAARSSHVIAISGHVGRVLAEHAVPLGKISVIPYGIDESEPIDPPVAGELRARLGADEGDVVIGLMGRMITGKGHGLLLRAVANLRGSEDLPRIVTVFAGDGPLRGEVEAQARRLLPPEDVAFLGFYAEPRRFMAACDIVVVPTSPELGEGFGLVALEAMAEARGVIASRVASLPEIIEDAVTGLTFAPNDAVDLARRLAELARDPGRRSGLGEAGRTRVSDRYSADALAQSTLKVYESLHPWG